MLTNIICEEEIKKLKKVLDRSEKIAITCHVSPDGDAIGSSLGLALSLSALDKDVTVVVPDMFPKNLMFLPGAKEIVVYSKDEAYATEILNASDLIFVLDYNEPSRTDRMSAAVTEAKAVKAMIDHHLFPTDFTDIKISHPEVSSTAMLVFKVLCAMGLYDIIDKKTATCLYTGMMTDTGNFSYNSNDPDLYIAISEFLKKGIDKDVIYKKVYFSSTPDKMRLNAFAIDRKMDIIADGCGAIITLTRNELNHYHYQKGDTEGLVNQPLTIPEIVFSIFLREEENCIKISSRSKGDFPVNLLCERHFGGGGHKNAAGGHFNGSMEDAVRKVLDVIPEFDEYFPKNGRK